MKDRIKQNKLGSIIGVVLCLSVISSFAASITSASATGSSSGFGTISYNVGENVNEFVLYGRTSASAGYITSTGTLNIAQAINGDGANPGYNNSYEATKYSWTGGTPTSSGTHNIETAEWVGSISATPYTWASISATAPSAAFEFSFFAHDYYVSTDLQVLLNGSLLGSYTNIMSSSYTVGGGEARNTDYFYDFNFSGMTTGDTLEFKFVNMQDLGSQWANIGFLSASLNYVAPVSITSNLKTMPNQAVPEPASALLLGCGAALIGLYRRCYGRD